ncbi:SDR family oxidoreductase [Umezawaea tangerina]|uniref:NAD(P)H dehydrogenase (Quinone) n=1 Tax=Umezawaea tangerina TaxID=84725 RepID=A0A2T0SRR7_9PSEU|nr:SDR family oxidoreductase [Umezawaea tangerina]PRY36099.1 NAD(P)H dehydrogenase (quinone) [Umezawaea tangerina]
MIVVTGATGHLGKLVVEGLLRKVPATAVVAAVRTPSKAADLTERGVQVKAADYSDPASLVAAFQGADKVLLVSSSEVGQRVEQHTAVVEAAKEAGVTHLVYTSILNADTTTMLLAADHKATEEVIRASGIPFTFLRNGWYTENYAQTVAQAVQTGEFAGSAADGKVGAAPRADYADAAVTVLTTDGHQGNAYELAADVPWSYQELADELTRATGKPITYQDVPAAQHQSILESAGVPAPFAAILVDSDRGITAGELASTSGDLSRLAGRPTTPLTESVAEILKG